MRKTKLESALIRLTETQAPPRGDAALYSLRVEPWEMPLLVASDGKTAYSFTTEPNHRMAAFMKALPTRGFPAPTHTHVEFKAKWIGASPQRIFRAAKASSRFSNYGQGPPTQNFFQMLLYATEKTFTDFEKVDALSEIAKCRIINTFTMESLSQLHGQLFPPCVAEALVHLYKQHGEEIFTHYATQTPQELPGHGYIVGIGFEPYYISYSGEVYRAADPHTGETTLTEIFEDGPTPKNTTPAKYEPALQALKLLAETHPEYMVPLRRLTIT